MPLKKLFSDKLFLTLIRLPLFSCMSGSITVAIFLGIIWSLSNSFASFLESLQSRMISITFFSTFAVILMLIVVFLTKLTWIKDYIFYIPINSEPNLKEIREKYDQDKYLFREMIWMIMFALVAIGFLLSYINGVPWDASLRASLLFVLPFVTAFLTLSCVKILVEIVLLLLRYFIQRNII